MDTTTKPKPPRVSAYKVVSREQRVSNLAVIVRFVGFVLRSFQSSRGCLFYLVMREWEKILFGEQ